MDASRIAEARLRGQGLTGRSTFETAADVVRALGAVQSQDYAGASWAVGMRMTGTRTARDIDAAFDRGDILRTHVLRPTWHFVTPADIRWMLALTAPRVSAAMGSYNRTFGLDAATFRRSNDAIARALDEHESLTRTELGEVLERAGVAAGGTQRLAHLVMQAELDAVTCSGPRRGRQFTYAAFDRRAPQATVLDEQDALREMALRYFRSRVPATIHDFAWWCGLTMAACRRAIALVDDEFREQRLGDVVYVVRKEGSRTRSGGMRAHLLPNYDEFFIGYRDRSAIGARLGDISLVTGGSALIAHVMTVDGQLVGGWKRRVDRQGTTLQLTAATRLRAAECARFTQEAQRLARFTEAPITLEWL